MRAQLRGPFRVTDDAGHDRTPRGMKERALLALLLLSPGQRRTRAWLQDHLWSDRGPEQAAASLRQALAHVRVALGPLSARLGSDRSTLWLHPPVATDSLAQAAGEPLSDLDVRDPEWEDWLRDLRQRQVAGSRPEGPGTRPPDWAAPRAAARPTVVICARRPEAGAGRFLARALSARVAAALLAAGDVAIEEVEVEGSDPVPSPFDAAVEVEVWRDAATPATPGGPAPEAFILMRALGPPRNRVVWIGRARAAMPVRAAWEGAEAQALVNRATQAVIDLLALGGRPSPFAAIARAVRRIYAFESAGLAAADALLKGAQDGDAAPLALAWRGFARLTQEIEFRKGDGALRDEAAGLSEEAVARAPSHPVVLALAAEVRMNLQGDIDLGRHLASRAVDVGDDNPYALIALSHALLWQGEAARGRELALAAREAADGLANSFFWDFHGCLAALGTGRLEEAAALALSCHRKMPVYRPALRYLVALSFLTGRRAEADHFLRRLKALEPDFAPVLLLDRGYPVETLRALGLVEALRPALGR